MKCSEYVNAMKETESLKIKDFDHNDVNRITILHSSFFLLYSDMYFALLAALIFFPIIINTFKNVQAVL